MVQLFSPPTPGLPARKGSWQRLKTRVFLALVASRARNATAEVDPETKQWLAARLRSLFPSRQATKITFEWRTDTYHTAVSPIVVTHEPAGVREVSLESR